MKNLLLFALAAIVLASCGPSAEEKLISDYEQRIGDTKIDLSFNLKHLDLLGEIKASDSVTYYTELLGDNNYDDETIAKAREFIQLYENDWDERTKRTMNNQYEAAKTALTGTEGIERYKSNPDKVLALKYSAVYTIKNPVLSNAEQEISKQYLIDPEKKAILATIKE